ncbi:MAG: amino acid adenylation domain-containing protein, partial [Acidobacteria bacterium]|nr:amino acid adenylation domain-containing protein [Acidobacteriota bacterium]
PTEAAIDVTCARCETATDPSAVTAPPVTIGTPIANVQVYALDPVLEPVPVGVVGELVIGGIAVGRGYYGRPALTAERYLPDPFGGAPGGRLYRTGDAARWRSDGQLDFVGRLDHQVKIRGVRVEPGEVEVALAEHPLVRSAAVVVREDLPGHPRLVAYVAPRRETAPPWPEESSEVLRERLRSFLVQRLPAHLVPAAMVLLDELPLTPSGKIDRRALPSPSLPVGAGGGLGDDPKEEVLLRVWRRVLGVESLGLDDEFLALGGDSILSMQIATAAAELGVGVTPAQVFDHSTVRRLARVAERLGTATPEAQLAVIGPVRLTPAQRWFFELDLVKPEHWNQAVLLEVAEDLDVTCLRRAARSLVRHHDALRARFEADSGSWRQHLPAPDDEDPLVVVDLARLRGGGWHRGLETAAAALQGSLDLEHGPLFRAAWLPGPETGQHRLLVVAHHLVVDGVSWRILLADLEAAYRQAQAGARRPALPAKTTSFQTWSEHLYRRAQSQDVVQQLDYWLALPWKEVCRLPVDHQGGINLVGTEEMVTASLDRRRTADLLQRSHAAYRTEPADLLVTALVRALSRWTGSSSVLLQLEGHGRDQGPDLPVQRTVGWFTSLFPMVLSFGHAATPGDSLVTVKEQLRQLPARGLGHGLLRYANAQGDSVSRLRALPRPEICFNYLGQFDSVVVESELFRPAGEGPGPNRAPEGQRPYLLEINAWVLDGCLELSWSYSRAVHRRETVATLAGQFTAALEALIEHCLSPEASGCTVSDFPLADLQPEELARVVDVVGDGSLIEDVYPLSPSQEGMLMYLQLQPEETGVFFNQLHCQLRGDLDLHAFQRCWQQVSDRHGSLRTHFVWQRLTRPVQVVHDRVEPAWTFEDWRGITTAAFEHRLQGFLEEDRLRGFDLERPPLVRFALLRIGDAAYHFVLSYHHLILDGWSLSLLFQEALKAYRASLQGRRLPLGPAPRYSDYVRWLGERDGARAEAFWRHRLAGFNEPTRLPGERGRPGAAAVHDRCRRRLSETQTSRLAAVARQQMLTRSTLLQGAWALLLHEQSGAPEVVFGNVVSGREAGFESTLGLFINALPVRTAIPRDRSMLSWLQQLQREQVEARQWEFCALEQIQRWSEMPWGQPLFESLLVFENYPVEGGLLEGRHGIEVGAVHAEERSNYPLSLFVFPGRELELELCFDSGRFDRPTAELLLARLETLLQRMLSAPQTTPAAPLALTAGERSQVLEEWNRTGLEIDRRRPVHALMRARAAATPAAPAVVHREGVVSYAELDRHAARLAAELRRRGVERGSVVAVWLERSPELIAALYGVLLAGAAYLPLDPLTPLRRLGRALAAADARLLVTRSGLVREGVPGGLETLCLDLEELPPAGEDATGEPPTDPREVAYLISTSGSTGEPKAVAVTHGSLLNHVRWAQREFELEPADRVLQFASAAFDASAEEIFPTLATGAALVLRDDAMLTSPSSFLRALEELEVSVVDLPTSYWHRLVQGSEGAVVLPRTLRLMVVGGERLDPLLLEQWRLRFGPMIRLLNTYGPTEATVVATCGELTALGQVPPPVAVAAPAPPEVGLGRPISNVRCYVVDRRGRPVPPGVPGELWIAGAGVSRGYQGSAAATALRFVPDPFGGRGERLFRTGDAVRWQPGGTLYFLGRLDAQLKVEGHRVEPGEIEACLLAQPAIAEALVVAIDSGPQRGRLGAFLGLAEGAEAPAPETLRGALRRELPEYMVPAVF